MAQQTPIIVSDGSFGAAPGSNYFQPTNPHSVNAVFEVPGFPLRRQMILQQSFPPFTDGSQTRLFRVFESGDSGASFAAVAAGPSIPTNAPGTSPVNASNYSVCQDVAHGILYLVHIDTNFFLSITPFNQAAKTFGASVPSTIKIPVGKTGSAASNAVFRPSDGSVWMDWTQGTSGGAADIQFVKFAAGTFAATTFVSDLAKTADFVYGLAVNPLDSTIQVVQQDSTNSKIKTLVIHTDDSFSASQLTPMTFPLNTNCPPRCDESGVVMFAGVDTNIAKILRYQSGDTPAYTYDVVNVPPLSNLGSGFSVAVGSGKFWFFFFDSTTSSGFGFSFIISPGPADPWSAVQPFLDSTLTNVDGMNQRVVATRLPTSGDLTITMGLDPISEGGQAYFESGAAPIPFTPFAPQITQAVIIPFPVSDPCCGCPREVGCVECSDDGNMYAISKGPFGKATK